MSHPSNHYTPGHFVGMDQQIQQIVLQGTNTQEVITSSHMLQQQADISIDSHSQIMVGNQMEGQEILIPDSSQQVVLVAVPSNMNSNNEGDMEIIVTTDDIPMGSDNHIYLNGTQFQQLTTTSSGIELPQSVTDYASSVMTSVPQDMQQNSHLQSFTRGQPDALYDSNLSNGIITVSESKSGYNQFVTAGMLSTVFQSSSFNIPPTYESKTLFENSPVKEGRTAPEAHILVPSNPGRDRSGYLESVSMFDQPKVKQEPQLSPEEQMKLEKEEVMKSLELVEAEWKKAEAESDAAATEGPDCIMLATQQQLSTIEESAFVNSSEKDPVAQAEQSCVIREENLNSNNANEMGCEEKPETEMDSDKEIDVAATSKTDEDNNKEDCSAAEAMDEEHKMLLSQWKVIDAEHKTFRRWKCDECDKFFVDLPSLQKHQKSKHNQNPYVCDECQKSFTTRAYLKAHMRIHTGEKNYVCGICGEWFMFSNMLRRHKFSFHQDCISECESCGKQFVSDVTLQRHICGKKSNVRSVKGNNKRKKACGKKQKNVKAPDNKTAVVTGNRPHTRALSRKEKGQVEDNTGAPTASSTQFTCILCREKFGSKKELKIHGKKHLGHRILRCDKCGKIFHDSIKLKMHKLSHARTTYTCNFCGKGFAYSATLVLHKKSHAGENGFGCIVCGKKFATASLLDSHKEMHVEKTSFQCNFCGKVFTSPHYLKVHKRKHTGEKHYRCLQCNESFVFSNSLRRHIIKVHGQVPNKRRSLPKVSVESVLQALEVQGDGENSGELPSDIKPKVDVGTVLTADVDTDGIYECSFCKRKFQSAPSLHTHMKGHVDLPFKCPQCKATFSKELYLQKHLRRHTDDRRYSCDVCEKSFRSGSYLEEHKLIHKGVKNYKCIVCEQEFTFATSLRRHLKSHSDVGPNTQGLVSKRFGKHNTETTTLALGCSLCNSVFTTDAELEEHMKLHAGEDLRYVCKICEKEFDSHKTLRIHSKSHLSEQSVFCEICNKTFRTAYYLKCHMNAHTGTKPYKCKYCDEHFTYASTRRRHQRTHVQEESLNMICTVCGKRLFDQSEFDRHMQSHTGLKPFMCDICGKTFASAALLKNHMNRHNGIRQYTCHFCNKSFLYHYRLQRHIKTHNAVKQFKCNACGKAFLTQKYLSTHLRSHTGEKPYKCEFCGEEFAFSNTFRRHKRIHTGQTLSCEVCGKLCPELFDLKRHMQSHSDVKPVACEVCFKPFSHEGSRKRHMKRIHPEIVMPFQIDGEITVEVHVGP